MKDSDTTIVVFRVLKGEVIACFPTEPGTNNPNTMSAYVYAGQHITVDANIGRHARLANHSEFNYLKKELESIGYKLNIKYRSCPAYRREREKKISLKYKLKTMKHLKDE